MEKFAAGRVLMQVSSVQLILVLTLVTGATSAHGQADPLAIIAIERQLADFQAEQQIPGVSLAIGQDGHIICAKALGLRDLENRVEATTATRFRTASIAKPLTATLIMSLAEAGQLDLDAPAREYCSDFPEKRWPVCVRQLLGHLGGIRHYRNPQEASATEHFFSLSDALPTFADDPLEHEPGTKFLYSSFGYNLLGSVAEGAGQQDFMSLLQTRVMQPAGMCETVVDDVFEIIPERSRGYWVASEKRLSQLPAGHRLQPGRVYNSTLHDTSMKIPGGGLLSTPSDLVRFSMALNASTIVEPASVEQMWTSQSTRAGEETGYGLGWRVRVREGRREVWHTGGQSGTSTLLMLDPEANVHLAIMCNLQDVAWLEFGTKVLDQLVDVQP